MQACTCDCVPTCKIGTFSPQMKTNASMFVITHAVVMVCRRTQQEINCLESGLGSV